MKHPNDDYEFRLVTIKDRGEQGKPSECFYELVANFATRELAEKAMIEYIKLRVIEERETRPSDWTDSRIFIDLSRDITVVTKQELIDSDNDD